MGDDEDEEDDKKEGGLFDDDEDELLPPQAAKVTADSKVTAPNPTRFQFEVIFINGSS